MVCMRSFNPILCTLCWEEKNIRASRKTVCEHESKDSICGCRGVSWVLLHFACALNESFLLSASAVKVFTIMICAHGFVRCSPAQSHVCWRLLSMICRHKRCRPVWAQCCNTIDTSLLTRARKRPGTIIGSGEDWGFRPKHPRHKQKHQ